MSGPLRILVTGSRDWPRGSDIRDALVDTIGNHHPCTLLVGDCPTGADHWARSIWEFWHSIHPDWYLPIDRELGKAHWRTEGKAAGPNRNQRLVDAGADVCLSFPLPQSRGTRDCVRRARAAGIRVVEHQAVRAQ